MSENHERLLIINPGSTSTKVAIYDGETQVRAETLRHSPVELAEFGGVWEQYRFRRDLIARWVEKAGARMADLDAIVCRGGTVKPIPGGVYQIGEALVADARSGQYGDHATNVGCKIAFDLGRDLGIPALTVDPPATDEFCDEARYSGLPQLPRQSSFHALNQKATARKLARDLGLDYASISAIVVHLGGGISVGAHYRGRVIDVNNALDGDGPFSPERSGALPVGALISLCFSGVHTRQEMMKLINGGGGLVAYLGTTDGIEIDKRINGGDETAKKVIDAMAYQVAKEIGGAAAVLHGKVDAIALTGGLANWKRFVGLIRSRVEFIAPIHLYPGENEIESLAFGALRALRGEEQAKIYA